MSAKLWCMLDGRSSPQTSPLTRTCMRASGSAVVAIRARQRRRDVHVGQHVLHGLERADRAAEGDAVERIVTAHFQRAVGAADLLERHQHRGAVEHLRQDAPAFAGRAERLGLAVLESQFGLAARGSTLVSGLASTPSAFRSTRNSEMSLSRPAGAGARGDDREVGDGAVGHRLLHAVEAAAGGGELDRPPATDCPCLRTAPACRSHRPRRSREPFLLLRVAAREQDRFGREIHRRGERHRRQRAAHFLGDHAEFEMAGAGAAEFSGIATPRKPISARPFHNSLS